MPQESGDLQAARITSPSRAVKISSESLMSLLSPFKASEETRQDRLAAAAEAKLREARAAAETLKAKSSQASEERKAAARQKIEQLKARLQMLRSMAGADPKGTARLAAQIARELGAAVKAYAAAGGSTSGMSAGAVPAAPVSAAPGAEGAAGEGAPAAATPSEGSPANQSDDAKGADGKTANPYQQAIDEQNARTAEMSRRSGEAKADAEFMADVRKIAAELKQLVRQATERAKAGYDDALSPQEAAELEKSIASMDQDIGEATADLGGGLVSLLV